MFYPGILIIGEPVTLGLLIIVFLPELDLRNLIPFYNNNIGYLDSLDYNN